MIGSYQIIKPVASLSDLKRDLEENGVAVVSGVLNTQECTEMLSGAWDFLEKITEKFPEDDRLDRNNPKTWRSYKHLFPSHNQLLQHYGVGHADFVWKVRENPKVISVFEEVWGTKDLLVSFDGASVCLKPEVTNLGWSRNGSHWLHTDQAFTKLGFECVQSWVTACDVEDGDATLLAIPGSHKFHHEFAERFGLKNHKDDWYKLANEKQVDFFVKEKGLTPVRVMCKAGDMVLWDSRTIHAGCNPVKGRPSPKLRCVAYLCYTPRSLATPKDLEKKRKAYKEGRTTSHWPHKPKLFGKRPRTYGADTSQYPVEDLAQPHPGKLRKLAGF